MNKGIFLIMTLLFATILVGIGQVSALGEGCQLDASLISQDPYPAVPGEYVKVVFQLTGLNDPDCANVVFELVPQYPFSLNPGESPTVKATGGVYAKDFQSFLIAPYELRVDPDAVDGDNKVQVRYTSSKGQDFFQIEEFIVRVEDSRTDFEVSVRDYDSATNTLTFDILNTGENNIEALTVDLPKQENFEIKGRNREIVGSLDSNEDTSFSFTGVPKSGQIDMVISYTDEINVRRQVQKSVMFDSDNFPNTDGGSSIPVWLYVVLIVVVVLGIWYWRRSAAKKKKKEMQQNSGKFK